MATVRTSRLRRLGNLPLLPYCRQILGYVISRIQIRCRRCRTRNCCTRCNIAVVSSAINHSEVWFSNPLTQRHCLLTQERSGLSDCLVGEA